MGEVVHVESDSSIPPLPQGKRWHFFLCNYADTGGDQCDTLRHELERKQYKVWHQNLVDELTTEVMIQGVCESCAFLFFLSKDVLQQPEVQLQYQEAVANDMTVVLLHETDMGRG